MKNKRLLCLVRCSIILFMCGALLTAEPQVLDLPGAVRTALAQNPSLIRHEQNLLQAEKQAASVWNTFLPNLSLSASLRNTHWFGEMPPSAAAQDPWTLGASAGLSLTLPSSLPASIALTLKERDLARLAWAEAGTSLARQVTRAFYTLAAAEQTLVISAENLQRAERQAALVERNYRSGLASELSWLQARYNAASLRPDLSRDTLARDTARRTLVSLLGLPLDTELVIVTGTDPDIFTIPDGDAALLVERRIDVRRAVLELEKTRTNLLAGDLGRFGPTISMSENFSVSNLQQEWKLPESGTFTLSVSIPLNGYIPGSRESLAGSARQSAVVTAEAALKQLRIDAEREILNLRGSLAQLSEAVESAALNVQLAERSYALSRDGYAAGLVSEESLNDERAKLAQAQMRSLAAEYNHKATLADLAWMLNAGFSLFDTAGGAE